MGSATLVFTMGRFLGLGLGTLALFSGCLIVLVNSNIDHNLKELGQVEGLSESLLKINHNELRWKRAAKEGKKSKGLKRGKNKKGNKTKKKKNGGRKWKNKKNNNNNKKKNSDKKKKKNKGKKKKKCNKKNGCKKGKKPKATKQPKVDSKQSCPIDQAGSQCLQNAIESLVYEQKQLTNFLKQAKLLENHERVSGNKGAKKGEFHHAADHALWAIGGNVSAPLCGPNSTDSAKYNSSIYDYEKALALESYETLSQCELNITFKCNTSNIEGYDPAFWAAKIQTCRALVDNYQETSKRCQAATDDGIEQCDCWAEQVGNIAAIKAEGCNIKNAQRNVTNFKTECLDTFTACKKKEDKSVESVYYCMDDHSMVFINQTAQSLALAAEKDVARKSPRSWHLHNLLIDLAS